MFSPLLLLVCIVYCNAQLHQYSLQNYANIDGELEVPSKYFSYHKSEVDMIAYYYKKNGTDISAISKPIMKVYKTKAAKQLLHMKLLKVNLDLLRATCEELEKGNVNSKKIKKLRAIHKVKDKEYDTWFGVLDLIKQNASYFLALRLEYLEDYLLQCQNLGYTYLEIFRDLNGHSYPIFDNILFGEAEAIELPMDVLMQRVDDLLAEDFSCLPSTGGNGGKPTIKPSLTIYPNPLGGGKNLTISIEGVDDLSIYNLKLYDGLYNSPVSFNPAACIISQTNETIVIDGNCLPINSGTFVLVMENSLTGEILSTKVLKK